VDFARAGDFFHVLAGAHHSFLNLKKTAPVCLGPGNIDQSFTRFCSPGDEVHPIFPTYIKFDFYRMVCDEQIHDGLLLQGNQNKLILLL
jgi:hypothetical protein